VTAADGGGFFRLHRADQVATVTVASAAAREEPRRRGGSVHWEFAALLARLRTDNGVRVVVLTGAEDGEFWVPPPPSVHSAAHSRSHRSDPAALWRTFTGIIQIQQTLAEIEKPVVARVNGDAVGTGSSVLFASDLSVAVEDAIVADHHLGMGELPDYAAGFGMVPGDGGISVVPLHMPPAMAKEYLMLARPYRARDLAALGMINRAVPADWLDQEVDAIVERLLRRPAYALAWTKRVLNRRTAEHVNLTADAAAAYEMVSYLQHELPGEGQGQRLG
jgi:enoyl-CoA hydratase/carnithine racemase